MPREMRTHPSALLVRPVGDPIFSEMATTISIEDEAAGPFVVVEQTGRTDIGKIAINADEWPAIRSAIDQMIELCASIEAEAGEQA